MCQTHPLLQEETLVKKPPNWGPISLQHVERTLRPGVQHPECGRTGPAASGWSVFPAVLLGPGGWRPSWVSLGLLQCHFDVCPHLPVTVFFLSFLTFLQGHPSPWITCHPSGFIVTQSHLQRPSFQMRPRSRVRRVKPSTRLCRGHTQLHHTCEDMSSRQRTSACSTTDKQQGPRTALEFSVTLIRCHLRSPGPSRWGDPGESQLPVIVL